MSSLHVKNVARRAFGLLKDNVRLLVIIAAALIFSLLLEDVAEGQIMALDVYAYRFFVEYLRSDFMTPIMEGFTSLSSVAVVLVMALIVSAFAPGRAPGRCVCANVIGALILNQVLKFIVQRPRPDGFRLATESSYSFPSGHSMISMAFYGLLIWMIWKYEKDDILRHVWCNVDEEEELATRFRIVSIPTLIVFKGGKPVHTMVGNMPKAELLAELEQWI